MDIRGDNTKLKTINNTQGCRWSFYYEFADIPNKFITTHLLHRIGMHEIYLLKQSRQ